VDSLYAPDDEEKLHLSNFRRRSEGRFSGYIVNEDGIHSPFCLACITPNSSSSCHHV